MWTLLAALALAAAPTADDLGWLTGDWVIESEGEWTEEHWSAPRDGMMIGINRSGAGGKIRMFEFMRIAPDAEGRLAFWASPLGREATAFPLTSSRPNEAVFENDGHDFPTKVVYRREGDRLIGTIYGPKDSNKVSWEFRRK